MLRIELRPSRCLAALMIAAHAAAAPTLLPIEVPVWIKVALAGAIAASLAHSLWRYALLRGPRAITAIELEADGIVAVLTIGDVVHRARVLGTTYVSPMLTVLNLRLPGEWLTRHALCLPDNVDPEAFRQLRVWLRWRYRPRP